EVEWKIEGKGRALIRDALHPQFAAERSRDLAADREPEPGAAIFSARGAIGLLEGLEDDPLLVLGDADAAVPHRKGDHLTGCGQLLVAGAPARFGPRHPELDPARRREFESV